MAAPVAEGGGREAWGGLTGRTKAGRRASPPYALPCSQIASLAVTGPVPTPPEEPNVSVLGAAEPDSTQTAGSPGRPKPTRSRRCKWQTRSVENDPRPVVILGAGFSKAVHDAFPVLSELAERVLPLIKDHAAPSTRPMVEELCRVVAASTLSEDSPVVDFEGWLSRLALPQPHLTEAETFERRALFARTATAIRQVLLAAEERDFDPGSKPPRWSLELLRLLDVRQTTVITMNYDTIIERLAQCVIQPWRHPRMLPAEGDVYEHFDPADLFAGLPPTIPPPDMAALNPSAYGAALSRRVPPTLRLLKLHGSLDWFASPDDTTGTTLIRWSDRRRLPSEDPSGLSSHPPGRAPFIVPPDANKSAHLGNPLVREMWSVARAKLAQATSVTLVGYSLPVTDTTFGGLLADTLAGRLVRITVVDKCPDPVVTRLRALGLDPDAPECHGEKAIEEWTTKWVERQAEAVANDLRGLESDSAARTTRYDGWVYTRLSDDSCDSWKPLTGGHLDGTIFVLDELVPSEDEPSRPVGAFRPPDPATTIAVDLSDGRHPIVDYHLRLPFRPGLKGAIAFLPSVLPLYSHP